MKIYGYTGKGKSKQFDLGFEDVLAIQTGGRKSSVGKLPEKSGEYKSYIRNSTTRKRNRRYFKKSLRLKLKKETDLSF